MINKDNILDELFRSKLDDFEQVPPSYVWMKIQERQKAGKKMRIVRTMRMAGIAAALLLAFLLGWQLQEHRNGLPERPVIAQKEQPEGQLPQHRQPTGGESPVATDREPTNTGNIPTEFSESVTAKRGDEQPGKRQERVSVSDESPSFLTVADIKIETPRLIRELKMKQAKKEEHEPILSEEDRKIIEMNKRFLGIVDGTKEDKTWSIGAQVSPALSVNQRSYNQTYASNMSGTGEKNSISLGGGISVRYETGKRWSIQSGLQYSRLNQSSGSSGNHESAMFSPSDNQSGHTYFNNKVQREPTGQLIMNGSAGVIEIERLPSSVRVSASLESAGENQMLLSGDDFEQRLEYIEVPLLVRYKLIDKSWNMHMLGGFSANMLVGNGVFINEAGDHSYVGKTKDMSRMNYSTSIGFGMGYRLTDKIQLNIEPQFKYFLRSLNDNPEVNFKPYSIGVYTGVSYRF